MELGQVFAPGEGGHPTLLQQGGQGHGHAVHVEHGQEGEDVHPGGSTSKLWMASLGEVGNHIPVGEANLSFGVSLITLLFSHFDSDY